MPLSDPTNLLPDAMVVTTTTGLITLALLALAPSLWRTQRTAVLTAAGIGLFALLIRLFASWGPGDLAEARRWDILYALQPESRPGMALVPNLANLLSHLGIPSLWLYRGVGLTTGAMIAVLTFTAATVSQLRKPWPVFAGLLVAAWPAHVHYSATGGYTTLGPLLFLLAWTLLRAETMAPIARLFLSSALLTASVYARPEYPLLALAVLPLLLQPGWNLRMRLTFLGTFAVFVVSYLAVMGSTHGVALESTWADHARWLIWDLRVSPTFWLVLAFLGLGLSTLDLWTRVSLGLGLIGLLVGVGVIVYFVWKSGLLGALSKVRADARRLAALLRASLRSPQLTPLVPLCAGDRRAQSGGPLAARGRRRRDRGGRRARRHGRKEGGPVFLLDSAVQQEVVNTPAALQPTTSSIATTSPSAPSLINTA